MQPWHKEFEAPAVVGPRVRASGRRDSRNVKQYYTLAAQESKGLLRVGNRTIDNASLCDGQQAIQQALQGTGREAPSLFNMTTNRPQLCSLYDAALNEAALTADTPEEGAHWIAHMCLGDYGRVNFQNLVGRLVLMAGQIDSKISDDDPKFLPLEPGATKQHAFALRPVVVSTSGDGAGDQGEIVFQGVLVSNLCFNYPQGSARRLSLGAVNPAFEETMCYVLVTHAYAGLSYKALNPPRIKQLADGQGYQFLDCADRNLYEHVFHWRAFMSRHTDLPMCGTNRSNLTQIKMMCKSMCRRIGNKTIEEISGVLAEARKHDLAATLASLPMQMALSTTRNNMINRPVGGFLLRFYLLVELLLLGTPLEPLLRCPEDPAPAVQLPAAAAAAVRPMGGAAGMYDRLKAFCDLRAQATEPAS